jgi:hypothetical protein
LRFKFSFVKLELLKGTSTFLVNSHLGESLDYNDNVLGYDLSQLNLQDLFGDQYPDVIVVKKSYPMYRANFADFNRFWKLDHFLSN